MNRLSLLIKYGIDCTAHPNKIVKLTTKHLLTKKGQLQQFLAYLISRDWYHAGNEAEMAQEGIKGTNSFDLIELERSVHCWLFIFGQSRNETVPEKVDSFIEACEQQGSDWTAGMQWYDDRS